MENLSDPKQLGEAFRTEGQRQLDLKEFEKAKASFDQAKALDGSKDLQTKIEIALAGAAESLIQKGNHHLDDKEIEKAMESFDQAVALDDQNQRAQNEIEQVITSCRFIKIISRCKFYTFSFNSRICSLNCIC